MHKVFIVEDEEILRNGMKKNINWKDIGYELVGDSPDGEDALPKIRETKPNIIITDIKMPFMDGLELSRIIKTEIPNIKIIVLTGYDEFDFAREALSIGADEYILKPFSSMKIKKVLNNISEKIRKENCKKVWEYEKFLIESKSGKLIKNFKEKNKIFINHSTINNKVEDFLKFGTFEEIDEFLKKYIMKLKETSEHSCLYTYYNYINAYMIASNFISEINGNIREILPEIYEIEKKCLDIESFENLKYHLKILFQKTINFRDENKTSKHRELIQKAKLIIKTEYMDPNLSLITVADHVEISPNHFSSIFKNETGETFINYLINFRITKSKEMLKISPMKIYEIAKNVGYTDSHYFSSIFRKITGKTPSEYRDL